MDLRRELQPPELDEALLDRLAELAAGIDGARPGEWAEMLEEFNPLVLPLALSAFDPVRMTICAEGHFLSLCADYVEIPKWQP